MDGVPTLARTVRLSCIACGRFGSKTPRIDLDDVASSLSAAFRPLSVCVDRSAGFKVDANADSETRSSSAYSQLCPPCSLTDEFLSLRCPPRRMLQSGPLPPLQLIDHLGVGGEVPGDGLVSLDFSHAFPLLIISSHRFRLSSSSPMGQTGLLMQTV